MEHELSNPFWERREVNQWSVPNLLLFEVTDAVDLLEPCAHLLQETGMTGAADWEANRSWGS